MKGFAVFSILLLAGTLARANTYSTTFSNPSSEAANWVQGGTVGGSWHNVGFLAGLAYGEQPNNQGNNYASDGIAVLTGSWGPTQTVSGTISLLQLVSGNTDEAEVHVRTTIVPGNITGYEVNCGLQPGNPYITITRWNGALGDFTMLTSTNSVGCGAGDVLSATSNGSTITAYKNGKSVLSVNDSKFTGGAPGVGFYNANSSGVEEDFGFSGFSATDGTSTNVGSGAGPRVNLNWTGVSTPVYVLRAQSSNCSSANYSQLATLAAWTSSYADTNVTANETYCYLVLPVSGAMVGSAAYAEEVTPTSSSSNGRSVTAPAPPAAIAGLNANVVN